MLSLLNNVTMFISKIGMAIGQDRIEEPTTEKWMTNILNPIRDIVLSLLWPILFILSVAGIIYVVTLGIQYAKAETPDKRDAAKSRMVNAIVGIVIMLVLIIVMLLIGENLEAIIKWIIRIVNAESASTATITTR